MAKAVKSLCFVFLACLLIFLASAVDAEGEEGCKKVYEGYQSTRCYLRIFPSACYYDCKQDKGAKSGDCITTDDYQYQCICDYCTDPYFGGSTTTLQTFI